MLDAFQYPAKRERRHGPYGYANYSSYRSWLRDEFTFRCVYCLIREEWGRLCGEFDLDHFEPQASRPELAEDYDNLIYACHTCNLRKTSHDVNDPERHLTDRYVRVYPTGRIEGLSPEAQAIISKLKLDSPKSREWRQIWIRNVALAKEHSPDHYERLLKYPTELPNLSTLSPKGNTKPDGIQESYFEKRSRGELPAYYLS